jgi:fucose permease
VLWYNIEKTNGVSMASLLLAIIYPAFISLGLPDSLLGSAWPEMHQVLGVELSAMGIVTTLIAVGTVISSLLSDRLTARFSTQIIVSVSVGLTAIGLLGFSFAPTFAMLCLFAIPYGLGAGSIDAALNNYVALHYTSRHMSWLHCFWGVGTVVSPYIMSYALGTELGWAGGYRIVGGIQIGILVILLATLPVWKKVGHTAFADSTEEGSHQSVGLIGSLKIKGVPYVLLGFLGYCAAESTVMVWASTYFFEAKSTTEEVAAALGSLFFIGMTVGRFLAGFISNRIGDKNMIRIGLGISAVGVVIIAIPSTLPLAIAGFLLIGLGFAPIYPSIIHSTPNSFGKENSQAIIGIQMAAAYLGATLAPPIFGLIANYVEIRLLPLYLATFMVISLVMLELLNKQGDARNLT